MLKDVIIVINEFPYFPHSRVLGTKIEFWWLFFDRSFLFQDTTYIVPAYQGNPIQVMQQKGNVQNRPSWVLKNMKMKGELLHDQWIWKQLKKQGWKLLHLGIWRGLGPSLLVSDNTLYSPQVTNIIYHQHVCNYQYCPQQLWFIDL